MNGNDTHVYADTDFILALIKPSDWLKESALSILAEHRGNIQTSLTCLTELLLIAARHGLDVQMLITSAVDIAHVDPPTRNTALLAAHYMVEYKLTPLDALHAATAKDTPIISSDTAFDRIGMRRIPLRP